VGSAEGFGVVFSEGKFGLDWGVVLVEDDFGELFLVVLELHFEGYFYVLSLGELDILDSFEFFDIEEEPPLFVLGSLLT
jgi:hypothetical protein